MRDTKSESKKLFFEIISYGIVGEIAALVEWSVFWICDSLIGFGIYVSTLIAFAVSVVVNWSIGRKTMYRRCAWKGDLLPVALVSAGGVGLNLLLMMLFADMLTLPHLPSKIAATGITFFYSFAARKLLVYRNRY